MEKELVALLPLITSQVVKAFALCGFGYSQADIDDAVQDVVIKLLETALAKFDPARGVTLATFVGRVAYNATIDRCRTTHHMGSLNAQGAVTRDSDDDSERKVMTVATSPDSPEVNMINAERRAALDQALARLSATDRLIFTSLADDASEEACAPVCEATGLKLSNVRKRLCLIKKQLATVAGF